MSNRFLIAERLDKEKTSIVPTYSVRIFFTYNEAETELKKVKLIHPNLDLCIFALFNTEWEKTKTVLPSNTRPVLVYLPNIIGNKISIGCWIKSQQKWQEESTGDYWDTDAISQWTELPQAPLH